MILLILKSKIRNENFNHSKTFIFIEKGGIISCHNITNDQQKFSFKPSDIPDIENNENYWIYDYLKNKVQLIKREETYNDELKVNEFGWYIILPEIEKFTCFGLLDKFVSFKAVESIINNENSQVNIILNTGTVGWASKQSAKKVLINGIDHTSEVKQNGEFYSISLPSNKSKEILILEW